MESINAPDAFRALCALPRTQVVIDVRSESEFVAGAFPGVVSRPILSDSHRHEVGLCYKRDGPDAAVKLGYELVAPYREEMIGEWLKVLREIPDQTGLVYCWRGGLRSRIACDWIHESGGGVLRVEGGFKALRQEVIKELGRPRQLLSVAGLTGSGKTRVLKTVRNHVDLEGLAHHSGSAFGQKISAQTPNQLNFENALAVALRRAGGHCLVEDESRMIGGLCLPEHLYQNLAQSPVLWVESPLEERVGRLVEEYVREPLCDGVEASALEAHLLRCLNRISRSLGGVRAQAVARHLKRAFASGLIEDHANWVRSLLVEYYDPLYRKGWERRPRKVMFRGNWVECREYLARGSAAWGDNSDRSDWKSHL